MNEGYARCALSGRHGGVKSDGPCGFLRYLKITMNELTCELDATDDEEEVEEDDDQDRSSEATEPNVDRPCAGRVCGDRPVTQNRLAPNVRSPFAAGGQTGQHSRIGFELVTGRSKFIVLVTTSIV